MNFRGKIYNNVLYKFLLTYVVIILVVASFFYPIYNATLKTVKENAVKDSYNSLQKNMGILDNEIIRIQDTAVALRNDSSFSGMVNLTDREIANEHHYIMQLARKFMRAVILPSDLLLNAYFLYKNNSILISRDIVTINRQEIYGRNFEVYGNSPEQWFQWVLEFNSKSKRIFRPDSLYRFGAGIDAPNVQKQVITYILPVTNESAYTPDSVLVCMLDSNAILSLLVAQNMVKNSFLTITDLQEQVILHYPADSEMVEYNEPGIFDTRLKDVDTTVMVYRSAISGLKITSGIPAGVFTGRIEKVMSMLRIFFILSISFGLLASFLFSYRNSLPVRRLLQTAVLMSAAGERKGDAYERIQQALVELNRLKEGYREEIDILGASIKINLFDQLLKGGIQSTEKLEEAAKHLDFLLQEYIVIIVRFISSEISEIDAAVQQYDTLIKVVAGGILKKSLQEVVFVDNLLLDKIVVVVRMGPEKRREDLIPFLAQSLQDIQQNTLTRVSAAISLTGKGPGDLRLCYSQAMSVLRMDTRDGEEKVTLYTDEMEQEQIYFFGIRDVQKLYELLWSGEAGQVESMLDDICRSILRKLSIPDHILRRIYYNIQNVIIFAAKDLFREDALPLQFLEYSEEKSVAELFNHLSPFPPGSRRYPINPLESLAEGILGIKAYF